MNKNNFFLLPICLQNFRIEIETTCSEALKFLLPCRKMSDKKISGLG